LEIFLIIGPTQLAKTKKILNNPSIGLPVRCGPEPATLGKVTHFSGIDPLKSAVG